MNEVTVWETELCELCLQCIYLGVMSSLHIWRKWKCGKLRY